MYLSDFCRFLLCTCGWERRGERRVERRVDRRGERRGACSLFSLVLTVSGGLPLS